MITNECGLQGRVAQVPVTAKRVADVPSGIEIPVPTSVSPAPPARPRAPGDPVLDGTYRVDFDDANVKKNGVVTRPDRRSQPEYWAFRSLCGALGCVATAVQLDEDNNQVPRLRADVAHFVAGQWNSKVEHSFIPSCTVTRNGVTGPEQSPQVDSTKIWTPQPDGSLRGVQSLTVKTNECLQEGTVNEFPFVARRIGQMPASVVVADPQLFIS